MRALSLTILAAVIVVGILPLSVRADYLKNTDLKEGLSCWSGDGEAAFLNPDGTEGAEGDQGVIPVIKLPLSRGSSRAIYQEFEAPDTSTTMHIKVDVFASADFKRSKFEEDYSKDWTAGGTWYWSGIVIPTVDFWIRGGDSGWFYKLSNLKAGAWTTVTGSFQGLAKTQDRVVNFCVPAGEGTIYIKNPSANP